MKKKVWIDHSGNEFRTRKEMCEHHSIDDRTFAARISSNWSLEKALTTTANQVEEFEYDGVVYKSFAYCCRVQGIRDANVYNTMKRHNVSKQEAIDIFLKQQEKKRENLFCREDLKGWHWSWRKEVI